MTLLDAPTLSDAKLREQASDLRLHGLLDRWAEVMGQPDQARWVAQLLGWEAAERHRRSLERRVREARIGQFKSIADFDWQWPTQGDRAAVEELMTLDFLKDASNVVLVGPRATQGSLRDPGGGQDDVRVQPGLPSGAGRAHGAVHHGRPTAGGIGGTGQRLGLAPATAPLRGAGLAGDRRGRLPVVLEPSRRSAVRTRQPALPVQEHGGDDEPEMRCTAFEV